MGRTMTSKERVLAVVARQAPDRVPINYYANAGIDGRLKTHFGLAADDAEGLRKALGVDFRHVSPPYIGPRLHDERPGLRVDPQWGIVQRWMEHDTGGYWDDCEFPLRDADAEAVADWPMPSPDDFDYDRVVEDCRRLNRCAVCAGNSGMPDVINTTAHLRGMEQILVDLLTADPAGLLLVDRRHDIQMEVLRRTLEIARGSIDLVWLGEDLGTQIAPLVSPAIFRDQMLPRLKKFVDLARSFDLPAVVHCCGSSSWAFDDFVRIGVSMVDTLQPEAKDMAPAYLKKRFGDRLAFHGCISTAGPVAYGTVPEVEAVCRDTLEIMMPGGGYCFSPTHALQDNSPTENVLAMYDTARRFGRY